MDSVPSGNQHAVSVLEVCVGSLEDAVLAERCGAQRIELNSALPLGGLTPSAGLLREVLAAVSIPVIAMIRPRPGGFCYSDADWRTLLADLENILSTTVSGVAIGALNEFREIDTRRLSELARITQGRQLVFHRAFDLTHHWPTALEQLVDAGVNRLLTSGQQSSALAGAQTLQRVVAQAAGRIEIVAGGGITPENAEELLDQVPLRQLHGTFSMPAVDPGYGLSSLRFAPNDQHRSVNPATIRKMRNILNNRL